MPDLTPEQIEQRRLGIGASEAAQALGLSQWGTAYELWLDKRGEGEERQPSDEMSMGHLMEPVIAKLYETEHECLVIPVKETFVHPEHAWLMATPDYKVAHRAGAQSILLECKNINSFRRKEFGEEGTDEVPMDVLVQCLAQMAVLRPLVGVERVDVGVLCGGAEYLEYTVGWDQSAVDRLIERLAEFYQRVQSGSPPAPQTLLDVRRMFSRDVGRVVEASEQVGQYVEQLRNVRNTMARLEEQEEFLKLGIQTHMQDASTLVMPDGQIAATWKSTKPSQRLDTERLKSEHYNIYMACLGEPTTQRRFLLK